MACNCHGKAGVAVKHAAPYDQCTTCAKKHIVKAHELFLEFTYTDDNRDTISGQLRLAVDHLAMAHRETALLARDLAVMIEENRDSEIGGAWETLMQQVRQHYYDEHPEAAKRLAGLRETEAE